MKNKKPPSSPPKCKICGERTKFHDSALVQNLYQVSYFVCPVCGFIQTEEPYWLAKAYSSALAAADTGAIWRNFTTAHDVLYFLHHYPGEPCLDFGGGHGVLTRLMRDWGYDYYHYDKYGENIFATGFDGDLEKHYGLITAFENFEHFVDPMGEITRLLAHCETLFFSTTLIPTVPAPKIKDWWYFAPDTGQHISFYSLQTLQYLGKNLGVHLLSNGCDLHLFSRAPIKSDFFAKLGRYQHRREKLDFSRKLKKPSKTWDDMLYILANHKDQ